MAHMMYMRDATVVASSHELLRLDHHVTLLHRVPDGVSHAEPGRADGGRRPEGAPGEPPATAQ